MLTQTLRPGFLVSLKTSVRGNVSYDKKVIEREYTTKAGIKKAKWETERTIADPEEHERGQDARTKASAAIRRVCVASAFGLLCPEDRTEELEAAIAEGRKLAEEFNDSAKISRINLYVIAGKIAPDDVEAVKAINSEIRDLMSDMQEGLSNLDVKKVREAAIRAKSIGNMLTPDAQARIQLAIDAARESAKRIVAAGEQVAQEVDRATIKRIGEQRVAFLDLEEAKPVAKPKAKGRAVDYDPLDPAASDQDLYNELAKRKRRKQPQLDI